MVSAALAFCKYDPCERSNNNNRINHAPLFQSPFRDFMMPDITILARLAHGTGVSTVLKSTRDVKLLFLQRFFRLFAYGATFIILVHFLSSLDISDEHVGFFMTLTMLGDVVIGFVLTLITDQVGRRKVLSAGAILMTASGTIFAFSSTYWILCLASVLGVISPR